MRGIIEKILKQKLESLCSYQEDYELLEELIAECEELQEPWMTLDEFLKSGFIGECWIFTDYEAMECAYHDARGFRGSKTTNIGWPNSCITHVQPIRKPEAPKI